MTIFAPNTFTPDKRRHVRIPFASRVKVSGQDVNQGCFAAKNLSLGGIYLTGSVPLRVGNDCRIELHATSRQASLIYPICGTIVYQDEKGFGVRFTGMEERCFVYLQTMMLYGSDDPMTMADYFIDGYGQTGEAHC